MPYGGKISSSSQIIIPPSQGLNLAPKPFPPHNIQLVLAKLETLGFKPKVSLLRNLADSLNCKNGSQKKTLVGGNWTLRRLWQI